MSVQERPLTKDSSGQPLLMPMVPGSSRRLKSFFWNWKPLMQPFRQTAPTSSALWLHAHTHKNTHACYLLILFWTTFSLAWSQGEGAGGSPSCIWAKAGWTVASSSQGPRFGALFKVISAVLWRCTDTYSATGTPKLLKIGQTFSLKNGSFFWQ